MTTKIRLHLIKPNHTGYSVEWDLYDLHVFDQQFRSGFFCDTNSFFEILSGNSGWAVGTKFTIFEWKMLS